MFSIKEDTDVRKSVTLMELEKASHIRWTLNERYGIFRQKQKVRYLREGKGIKQDIKSTGYVRITVKSLEVLGIKKGRGRESSIQK